jgi:hypothetical protein
MPGPGYNFLVSGKTLAFYRNLRYKYKPLLSVNKKRRGTFLDYKGTVWLTKINRFKEAALARSSARVGLH